MHVQACRFMHIHTLFMDPPSLTFSLLFYVIFMLAMKIEIKRNNPRHYFFKNWPVSLNNDKQKVGRNTPPLGGDVMQKMNENSTQLFMGRIQKVKHSQKVDPKKNDN